MSPAESVRLVAYLATRCPAMKLEEGTADAWYADLADVLLADAVEAVTRVTRRQPFASLSEILAEVRALRRDRLARAEFDPPPGIADDTARYLRWLRAETRRVADGGEPAPAVVGARKLGELPGVGSWPRLMAGDPRRTLSARTVGGTG